MTDDEDQCDQPPPCWSLVTRTPSGVLSRTRTRHSGRRIDSSPFFPRPFSEWFLASGFSFFFFPPSSLITSGDGRVAGEKSNIAPPLPPPPSPPHWHLPPRRADACCGLSIPLPLFRSSLCSARTASHNHNQQRRESALYTVYIIIISAYARLRSLFHPPTKVLFSRKIESDFVSFLLCGTALPHRNELRCAQGVCVCVSVFCCCCCP